MESCTLSIGAMTCAACAARVERTLRSLAGVESATADLAAGRVCVSYDGESLRRSELRAAVERVGYKVLVITSADESGSSARIGGDIRVMQTRLIVAAAFTLLLLYLTLAPGITALPLPAFLSKSANPLAYAIAQLILTAPVVATGYRFYVNGTRDAIKLKPGIESLAALGTAVAVLYSLYSAGSVAAGNSGAADSLYFDAAAIVLTLIMLGKTLESMQRNRDGEAVEKFASLAPATAMIMVDNIIREIPSDEIERDDILLVRPGAVIPADGIIIEGAISVDESALTGGSMPVMKKPGDTVRAATVNIAGVASVRAQGTFDDTALARIIRFAKESPKAPAAKRADAILRYFIPAAIAAALLSAVICAVVTQDAGRGFAVFITVLTIACPCATGLSAVSPVMAGVDRASEHGALFKNGETLETAYKLNMVVFSKAGIITEGRPAVSDIITINDAPQDKLLLIAASAETGSEHPLGRAIVRRASEQGLVLIGQSGFTAIPGLGVEAALGQHTVLAGSRALMDSFSVDFSQLHGHADRLTGEGKTLVYVAVDGAPGGIIALSDAIKAASLETVTSLRELGYEVAMLTGDTEQTARAVAQQVGIDRVLADVLPGDKADAFKTLQDEGFSAAMVGDGDGDMPALAQANTGIALGCGLRGHTDNADIVLTREFLIDVSDTLELGRMTVRVASQNLVLALAFNAAGAVFAAVALCFLGWRHLTAPFAAAAVLLSCASVLINARRLRRFTPARKYIDELQNIIDTHGGITVMEKSVLDVEGMSCEHCVKAVRNAVSALSGVRSVEVSLKDKKVTVEHDTAKTAVEEIIAAITGEGYEVA